jgi:hypothetical protein
MGCSEWEEKHSLLVSIYDPNTGKFHPINCNESTDGVYKYNYSFFHFGPRLGRCLTPPTESFISGNVAGWVGNGVGLGGRLRKILPSPGFTPQTVQPVVSRYTDCAIPVHLCDLETKTNVNAPRKLAITGLWEDRSTHHFPNAKQPRVVKNFLMTCFLCLWIETNNRLSTSQYFHVTGL